MADETETDETISIPFGGTFVAAGTKITFTVDDEGKGVVAGVNCSTKLEFEAVAYYTYNGTNYGSESSHVDETGKIIGHEYHIGTDTQNWPGGGSYAYNEVSTSTSDHVNWGGPSSIGFSFDGVSVSGTITATAQTFDYFRETGITLAPGFEYDSTKVDCESLSFSESVCTVTSRGEESVVVTIPRNTTGAERVVGEWTAKFRVLANGAKTDKTFTMTVPVKQKACLALKARCYFEATASDVINDLPSAGTNTHVTVPALAGSTGFVLKEEKGFAIFEKTVTAHSSGWFSVSKSDDTSGKISSPENNSYLTKGISPLLTCDYKYYSEVVVSDTGTLVDDETGARYSPALEDDKITVCVAEDSCTLSITQLALLTPPEGETPEEAEEKGVPEIEPLPEIPGSKDPDDPEDPTFAAYKWTPGGIYWGTGTTENVPIETVFKQTYMTNVLTPDATFCVWKEHDPSGNHRDYYNGPRQDPADKAENPGYGFSA